MSSSAGWQFRSGAAHGSLSTQISPSLLRWTVQRKSCNSPLRIFPGAFPKDIVDIESVVLRQGNRLNVMYIRRWLSEFSDLLANPDILERFEQAYRKLRSK